MFSVAQIKKDLQKRFDEHGVTVELLGQTVTQTNALNEVLAATPTWTPQTVILRNVESSVDENELVTLPDGILAFTAPSDTLLVESSIFRWDGRLYDVKELRPMIAFKEVLCYIGRGERADANE